MTTVFLDAVDPGSSLPNGTGSVGSTSPTPDPSLSGTIIDLEDVGSVNLSSEEQREVELGPARTQRLNALSDVDVSNLDNNSFLVYNEVTQKWEARTTISVGGSVTSIEGVPTDTIVGRNLPGTGLSQNLTPSEVVDMLLSDDPENRLRPGTDGKLFNPELLVDPLAYYILAKA